MRKKIVAGNWKMHGGLQAIESRLDQLVEYKSDVAGVDVVLFPSEIYLPTLHSKLQGTPFQYGAQTVSEHDEGAYTGEVACSMLKDFGANWVIVGHSERRQYFGETNEQLAAKLIKAVDSGLTPVYCVGETEAEYDAKQTKSVIEAQISAVLSDGAHVKLLPSLVVAYEPVWAIGTGKTATPEYADETHQYIREVIARFDQASAETTSILYGGSVKANNAAELFAMPNVDGALVGGASLDAQQFLEIIRCIK